MSANNQTLIKEYKGKWYVFTDIMAESWCDDEDMSRVNELLLSSASVVCDTRDDAFEAAKALDQLSGEWEQGTEYGVQFNRLCKDDGEVKIIEEMKK